MTDFYGDSQSTSAPQVWGDISSSVFKYAPGNPLPFFDLPSLKADPQLGDGTSSVSTFKEGQYVRLGDSTTAHYDGAVWKVGPAPAPGGAGGQGVTPCSNPKAFTIPQVKSYIENDAADPCQCAADALLLEQEGPGNARGSLINWLENYIEDNCTPEPEPGE